MYLWISVFAEFYRFIIIYTELDGHPYYIKFKDYNGRQFRFDVLYIRVIYVNRLYMYIFFSSEKRENSETVWELGLILTYLGVTYFNLQLNRKPHSKIQMIGQRHTLLWNSS